MASPVKKDQRKKERPGRFRILIGSHFDKGPEGCECEACEKSGGKNHLYQAYDPRRHGDQEAYDNDIIDSDQDLVKRCNRGPGSMKFERLPDAPKPEPAVAGAGKKSEK